MSRNEASGPWVVRGVAVLALLVSAYCLWLGLGPFIEYLYLLMITVPEGVEGTLGDQLWWLALGAFGLVATRGLLRRSPRAPTLGLGFFTLAIATLLGRWSDASIDYWNAVFGENRGFSGLLRTYTGLDANSLLLFVGGLAMLVWLGRILLLRKDFRDWFGAAGMDGQGFSSRRPLSTSILLAAVLYLVIGNFPFLVSTILDAALPEGWAWPVELPTDLRAALPFLASAVVLLWGATERLAVDASGVSLYLFRPQYKLFFAKWSHVRFLDIVRHGGKPPTIVIHYRSRLGLPFSFGVHADRYSDSERVAADVLRCANEHQVKGRDWRSSPWVLVAGVIAFIMCVVFIRLGRDLSTAIMQGYVDGTTPTNDVAALFALMPLTKLFLAAVSCLGLGFGLHSAYHRGGPRPVLLVLLLSGVMFVPDPLLHWLVVMAINAILTAVQSLPSLHGSGGILTNVPSLTEFELAFGLVKAAPVFAGGAYILGVVLGRWPWRLIRYPRLAATEPALHGEAEALGGHPTLAVPQS